MIPEIEWKNITHIFVTHGDPDHYWHLDRVAKASGAPVICNKTMVRNELDGMLVTGIKTTHGELILKLGPFSKTVKPGPQERIGWGAIGFKIHLEGKMVVNLGDTLLHEKEWEKIKYPDVLMIPIGGRDAHNTMDEDEALKAVSIMRPKMVIPCHYNCPAFFTNKYSPADEQMFKTEVEKMGIKCVILHKGESVFL